MKLFCGDSFARHIHPSLFIRYLSSPMRTNDLWRLANEHKISAKKSMEHHKMGHFSNGTNHGSRAHLCPAAGQEAPHC